MKRHITGMRIWESGLTSLQLARESPILQHKFQYEKDWDGFQPKSPHAWDLLQIKRERVGDKCSVYLRGLRTVALWVGDSLGITSGISRYLPTIKVIKNSNNGKQLPNDEGITPLKRLFDRVYSRRRCVASLWFLTIFILVFFAEFSSVFLCQSLVHRLFSRSAPL